MKNLVVHYLVVTNDYLVVTIDYLLLINHYLAVTSDYLEVTIDYSDERGVESRVSEFDASGPS